MSKVFYVSFFVFLGVFSFKTDATDENLIKIRHEKLKIILKHFKLSDYSDKLRLSVKNEKKCAQR